MKTPRLPTLFALVSTALMPAFFTAGCGEKKPAVPADPPQVTAARDDFYRRRDAKLKYLQMSLEQTKKIAAGGPNDRTSRELVKNAERALAKYENAAHEELGAWQLKKWEGYHIPGKVDPGEVLHEMGVTVNEAELPFLTFSGGSATVTKASADFRRRRDASWKKIRKAMLDENQRLQKEAEAAKKLDTVDGENVMEYLEIHGILDVPALQKLAADARAHVEETKSQVQAWSRRNWEGYVVPADPEAAAPAPPP